MGKGLTAEATTTIDAPRARVWQALIDPAAIKRYMFGADVVSEWRVGRPIVWKGEWKGKPYEDKGEILRFEPEQRLEYSHWSPLSGRPDEPGNYHTVTIELTGEGDRSRVALAQDGNSSEEGRAHSQQNWQTMLDGLKKYVETWTASTPQKR
jgi:uncharacterized protein YndB with AHSA1/START domain